MSRVPQALMGVLLLALLAWSVLGVEIIPSHDGPHHIANCHIRNHLEDAQYGYGAFLRPGFQGTYMGFHQLCRPLDALLGWRWGYKLSIFTLSTLFATGFWYLGAGLGSSVAGLLGFAWALPWLVYMGFFDYFFASGLSLWLLGFLVRNPRPAGPKLVLASVGLLLISFVHMVAAVFLGLGVSLVLGWEAWKDRPNLRHLVIRVLVIGAPAGLVFLANTLLLNTPAWPDAQVPKGSLEWRPVLTRFTDLSGAVVGGDASRGVVVLAFSGLGLVMGPLFRPGARGRPIAVYGGLLLVIYFLVPFHWGAAASYFGPRTALLGVSVLALGIADGRRRWVPLIAVFLGSAYSILWAGLYHREMAPAFEMALAGLEDKTLRTGRRLPLILDKVPSAVEHVMPIQNAGNFYLLDQGGVNPYLFAEWPLTDPLLFVDNPARLFGTYPPRAMALVMNCSSGEPGCLPREESREMFALLGRSFDDVILVTKDPETHAAFERRGYVTEFHKDAVTLAHPGVCSFDVVVEKPLDKVIEGPVLLALGREPLRMAVLVEPIELSRTATVTQVPVRGPDCGRLWIQVRGKGGEGCEGGKVVFETAGGEVKCRL